MGNAEANLPHKESPICDTASHHNPQTQGRGMMSETTRFHEASKMALDRPGLEMMSASIRGEIMAIRAGRPWGKAPSGGGELEIVDLRVGGRRSCNASPVEPKRENRSPQASEATKRPVSPARQNESRSRLKFSIDNILAAKTKSATTENDQDQPKNLSMKRRMDSSSDYSSDDCRGSEDSRRSPLSLLRSEEEERFSGDNSGHLSPPHKLARLERRLNPSPPKTLKFHPYHIKRSLSRSAAEPQELRHGIAPSPRARGKSESPKSGRPVFPPSVSRRPSGSFVEVLPSSRDSASIPAAKRIPSARGDFFPTNFHFPRAGASVIPQRVHDVRPTFIHTKSRATDEVAASTFRSVSESDDVFREDMGSLPKVARQWSPEMAAKNRSQPRTTWRAFEPRSPDSPQSEVFRSICQQRERLATFPTFVDRTSSLPSSPVSPSSPNGLSLQAWQAIAANCHPSLRHLVYPYAYGGTTAAAAMALAAVRSLKTFTPGLGEVPVTSEPSNPSTPAFDEKRKVPKKRRKWSRAVFSLNQRRGLERSFQVQKYVAKPERKGLAEALGLTDAQVKIWFQNRRMKWRQELKNSEKQSGGEAESGSPPAAEQEHAQLVAQSC